MLKHDAQENIERYILTVIKNAHTCLDIFDETGNWKMLDSANVEESRATCYYDIYCTTIISEDYDPKFFNELMTLRERIQKTMPHGA